ncbi:MAG: tRNA (adenosine(37)-N6)-threonylcarbamoyltransferase complex ATPase subunit type 1 TsaE [Gammaproteobacteria bacterium]|nr:tRNA (adenosine(37)-N6)-threonylcarbamoyltransferase complex ATPase subunit type 1 TsaE [Gammaproteobacteria bacterium]
MPESLTRLLADASATEACGGKLAARLARAASTGACVWLQGELGAGKTTLVRGLLRGLGHTGRVPSPTYTLVEPYELSAFHVYHIDLYRLQEPSEADQLGLIELPGDRVLLLIEWPEQAKGHVPPADLVINLALAGARREARLTAQTATGTAVLTEF